MATYKSLTAGSTFITPAGKTLRFMGPAGGQGTYVTEDAGEIVELDKLDKDPIAQVFKEVEGADTTKRVDPAIAEAAHDAAISAERAATPEVVAAQESLANKIAAAKGK